MKLKVLLAHPFNPVVMEKLRESFLLVVKESETESLKEWASRNPDAAGLISFLSDPVDSVLMDMLPGLKVIANFAVGYNNIDVGSALDRKIWVTHTPDVLTSATADLTMGLILAAARRIPQAHRFTSEGKFEGWKADLFLGKDLDQAILGIIGLGRIGLAVAKRGKAFGMKILYHSRTRNHDMEKLQGYDYSPLPELVACADVISLHLPYSADVHHLMNEAMFARMKHDAIFINTARGKLVDESCLASKLEHNELFCAGLDVFEFEPEVTEKLKRLDNAVLLPHIGSATHRTRRTMAEMAFLAVFQALSDEIPEHLIPEWKRSLLPGPPVV